jgi:prepilin-type N-terminal cleavage/methylation domain-containing protein
MLRRIKGFTLIELLIVVAIIAILAAIAVPNFLEAQTRSKVSRVRADLRSLATGVESYFVDNNSYPLMDSSRVTGSGATATGYGANNIPNASPQLLNMPTFRRKADQNDAIFTVTTPIAYITSYFGDPFANTKRATFFYSRPAPTLSGVGWIMWSFGPDTDETGPNPGNGVVAQPLQGGDVGCFLGSAGVDTNYYNPNVTVPSPNLIASTYDPTNGTTSNGDVYRIKE